MRVTPCTPAVDVQRLSGDAAGQVAGHEHDRRGHLVLGRQPLEIGCGGGRLVDLLDGRAVLAGLVTEVALQRAAPDIARQNGIDADALLPSSVANDCDIASSADLAIL